MSDQPLITNSITCVGSVLTAIYLDAQSALTANKIDNVWSDRLLPNKFVSIDCARTDAIPQL